MAVYLGSNWVGETRAIYSDTGESLTDFIENGISGAYENSEVTNVRNWAFGSCTSLTAVNFPNVTTIGRYAFNSCASLSSVSLPAATTIEDRAFMGCTSLPSVSLSAATTIRSYAFYSCTSLSQVSLPTVMTIEDRVFCYCTSLSSMYMLGSRICSLSAANTFYSTPMSQSTYIGTYGSIYVPASLYSSYKTATNWTVYSSRFASVYGTITWGFVSADGQRYARIRDNNGNVKTGTVTVAAGGISYDYQDGTHICDEATWDTLSPDYGYSYSTTFNNGTTSHSLTMTRSDYDDPFIGYLLI